MNLTIEQINQSYPAPSGDIAIAFWIPMSYREDVLKAYRDAGIKVRIRYRGPRKQSIGRIMKVEVKDKVYTYRRTRRMAMQDCLIQDATHFSVYHRR
jgi:hypothetical protein